MSTFPNVPAYPGVPPLNRPPGDPLPLLTLITADLVTAASDVTPQWGIFLNGDPVVVADSVVAIEYKQQWLISDYPVEQGSFQTYNKVQVPFDVRVRFSAGGDLANRQALLDSIAAIAGDLNLYDVVTPEETYSNANITHYDYKRTNNQGLGLIQVDVYLEEVRTTATQSFTNTKSPSGANPVADGNVQPAAPTPDQVTGVDDGIPTGLD